MAGSDINTGRHRVWTFLLLSGPAVQITLPGNPPLDFQSRQTIWKIVASKEVADTALNLFKNLGIKTERYTEEETPEMVSERQKYHGR